MSEINKQARDSAMLNGTTPYMKTGGGRYGEGLRKQPTVAQDAYNKGDKVHYPDEDGPVYESTVDNNVWEPGVYGWELIN